MRRAIRRAFTLIELLVYMVLMLLFMTGIYFVFVLSFRFFHMSQARSDGLQASLMAVRLLKQNLASANASTVKTQSGTNPACMFLSAQPNSVIFTVSASPKIYWQNWVCIYLDSQENLRMAVEAVSGGPTTSIPTAPTFAAMMAIRSRVLASNVSSASFAMSTTTLSYQMTAQNQASVSNGQLSGATLAGQYTLRN